MRITRRNFIGRDVVIVLGVLIILELLMAGTSVHLLQIPGYLILVAYDYAQNVWFPGLNTALYIVGFALYLYVGAVVIANLYMGFRQATLHRK